MPDRTRPDRRREPDAAEWPAVQAVLFDWGGTMTPWRSVDFEEEARALAAAAVLLDGSAPTGEPDDGAEFGPPDSWADDHVPRRLARAVQDVWGRSRDEHTSATVADIFAQAGMGHDEERLVAYREFWTPHSLTDPDVVPLLSRLRLDGLKIGVLSNTVWPRAWHEDFFERDGVLDLIDGAVYTSEVPWTKPSPEAFRAAMHAVGVDDPAACVFVGDRLFDDIWGAAAVGMRTIHVPHSVIPRAQVGHTEGTPDAVVSQLAHVYDVVSAWRSSTG